MAQQQMMQPQQAMGQGMEEAPNEQALQIKQKQSQVGRWISKKQR